MNDYIKENINKNKEKYEELSSEYQLVRKQEEELKSYIAKVQEKEDIDYEVFSPRNQESVSKIKIAEYEKNLRSVKAKRDTLKAQMNQLLSDNLSLQDLSINGLHNIDNIEKEDTNNDKHNQFLEEGKFIKNSDIEKMILKIENCLKLLDIDLDECETELKNLIYVIKHI